MIAKAVSLLYRWVEHAALGPEPDLTLDDETNDLLTAYALPRAEHEQAVLDACAKLVFAEHDEGEINLPHRPLRRRESRARPAAGARRSERDPARAHGDGAGGAGARARRAPETGERAVTATVGSILEVAGRVPLAWLVAPHRAAMRANLERGVMPERELRSLLEGDLATALRHPDASAVETVLRVSEWIDRHLPACCHGCRDQVQLWVVYVRRARGRVLLAAFEEGRDGDAETEAGR